MIVDVTPQEEKLLEIDSLKSDFNAAKAKMVEFQ
jgi:hypothetical protein